MNFKAGTLLQDGRYVIDIALGSGYFGATYRAMHTNLVQPVAIKTLDDGLRDGDRYEEFKRQFIEQARRLANCPTPHLPRLLDIFEEDDRPFVVMDYVPGSTLSQLVASGQPMPVDRATSYIRQVGAALSAIHAEGLLHRDIQPDHAIRQFGTDRIVTIDIGFTRDFTAGINQTHCNLLAAGYAAPEQYDRDGARTVVTDVYSLAALLYFLLTGTAPIAAPLRDRVPLPPVRELNPAVPAALEAAVETGLAIDPDARPASINAFLSTLPELVPSTSSSRTAATPSREPAPLPPFARPWVPALFAVTSIVSAIGGAGSVMLLRASNAQVEASPYHTLQNSPEFESFRNSTASGGALFDNRTTPESFGSRPSPTDYDREVEFGAPEWQEPQYAVPTRADEPPQYDRDYRTPTYAGERDAWEPDLPDVRGDMPSLNDSRGSSYSRELEAVPDTYDPRSAFEDEPRPEATIELDRLDEKNIDRARERSLKRVPTSRPRPSTVSS